jgi:hypothetical protein
MRLAIRGMGADLGEAAGDIFSTACTKPKEWILSAKGRTGWSLPKVPFTGNHLVCTVPSVFSSSLTFNRFP